MRFLGSLFSWLFGGGQRHAYATEVGGEPGCHLQGRFHRMRVEPLPLPAYLTRLTCFFFPVSPVMLPSNDDVHPMSYISYMTSVKQGSSGIDNPVPWSVWSDRPPVQDQEQEIAGAPLATVHACARENVEVWIQAGVLDMLTERTLGQRTGHGTWLMLKGGGWFRHPRRSRYVRLRVSRNATRPSATF